MTLEQIDKALAEWQSRLSVASNNLLELDDFLTYKRLKGDKGMPPARLTGVTESRVTPALAAIGLLWQYMQQITDVINRATDLRKSMPRLWTSENTLGKIEQLLTGPSITLQTTETPLAQRGLLSGSAKAQTITPEQLLNVMTRAFDLSKQVILDVDAAWNRLEPAMAACDAEATDLQNLAGSLGEAASSELDAARRKIASLRALVESDPLGVNADLHGEVAPILQRVRARLGELAQRRDSVRGDLQRARDLLHTLRDLQRQSEEALKECQSKVENPAGLRAPIDPASIADLSTWLDTLEATLQQGRWESVRVGLDRWHQTADSYLVAERTACAANRAPLDARAELRGRLSSLRAKAQAYTLRGMALDPALARLAEEADRLLHGQPTPLDRATALVSEYEARLARCLKN